MTYTGHLIAIQWHNPYTTPPNDWPVVLAEMFIPAEQFKKLHGHKPAELEAFPNPIGSGYNSIWQALNTPVKTRPPEVLAVNRRRLLEKRMVHKYPLFANEFARAEVERKPRYYLEGIGDHEEERARLLAWEKARFDFWVSHPCRLYVYTSPFASTPQSETDCPIHGRVWTSASGHCPFCEQEAPRLCLCGHGYATQDGRCPECL